jgi:orotate phosphoribosyltransferase-like protein
VQFSVEEPHDEWAFGAVTEKAATLKKKGCSTEEIAQRLQIPTREVEMVLAISGMARTEKLDRGVTAAFPMNADAARTV